MDNIIASKVLQSGMNALDEAKKEDSRPKEDVVTYLVCNQLRKAAFDFCRYYLILNEVGMTGNESVFKMKELCSNIDPAFRNIDFGGIPCFNGGCKESNQFCQEVNMVNGCLSDVEKVKNIVFDSVRMRSSMIGQN
ncbi:MAG: hypothetical protein GY816_09765 [Cytophagales bacterium]|nr:hypothetical protein [Cytophagales bacterium]